FRRFAARNYAVASRAASDIGLLGAERPRELGMAIPPGGLDRPPPSRAYKRDMKISRTSKSRGGREFPRRAGRIRAFRSAGGLAHGRTRKAGNEPRIGRRQPCSSRRTGSPLAPTQKAQPRSDRRPPCCPDPRGE